MAFTKSLLSNLKLKIKLLKKLKITDRVRTLFCEQNSRLFPDFFQTIFFIFQTQDNSEILHSPRRNNCLNYENNE